MRIKGDISIIYQPAVASRARNSGAHFAPTEERHPELSSEKRFFFSSGRDICYLGDFNTEFPKRVWRPLRKSGHGLGVSPAFSSNSDEVRWNQLTPGTPELVRRLLNIAECQRAFS